MHLAILGPLLLAATWYVQPGDAGVGNGSQGNPFGTVTEGLNAASSGDTVLVGPGTYAENIVVTKDGVHLVAQAPGTAILDGSGGASSNQPALSVIGANWVIDGMTFLNGGERALEVAGNGTCPQSGDLELSRIKTGGTITPVGGSCAASNFSAYGVQISCLSGNLHLHDSTFLADACVAALYLEGCTGALIERNELSNAHWIPLWVDNQTGGELRQNYVHAPCCDGQLGGGTQNTAGINIDSASRNVLVDHNLLVGTGLWGVAAFDTGNSIQGENDIIRNNTIYGPSLAGIHANAVDLSARSNLVANVTCPAGSCSGACPNPSGLVAENSEGGPNPTVDVGWDLYFGMSDCIGGGANLVDAGPLLTGDPLFVSAGTDFHLRPGSPAIDQADPATPSGVDFDGFPVPTGARADIGAFEFQPDSGAPTDAGPPTDGGPPADAGNPTDGGNAADGGHATDGGTLADAGPQPIAVIVPDAGTVDAGATIVLDGSGSTAPAGRTLVHYFWFEAAGPTGAPLVQDAKVQTLSLPAPGLYRFQLAVQDSAGVISAPAEADFTALGTFPAPTTTIGCSCASFDGALAWLGVLGLVLFRRRAGPPTPS